MCVSVSVCGSVFSPSQVKRFPVNFELKIDKKLDNKWGSHVYVRHGPGRFHGILGNGGIHGKS